MTLWKALGFVEKGERPLLRCSFCNKTQREVRMLIAGPTSYICDGCVSICVGIVAKGQEERSADPTAVPCLVCSQVTALRDTVRVGTKGVMCTNCMDLAEEALASADKP